MSEVPASMANRMEMVRHAQRRGVVRLDTGVTATLVRWGARPGEESTYVKRHTARVQLQGGAFRTVKLEAVVGLVLEDAPLP